MKKTNTKKGFTIIELVIVIAVIGILAAVLIPTFSGVIEKANESAAMQAARNEYEVYLSEHAAELTGKENFVIVYKNTYAFEVKEGQFNATPVAKTTETIPTQRGTLDLTQVKTEEPTSFAPNKYYLDFLCTKLVVDTTETTGNKFVANTTYYTQGTEDNDIGNADVAIYKAA